MLDNNNAFKIFILAQAIIQGIIILIVIQRKKQETYNFCLLEKLKLGILIFDKKMNMLYQNQKMIKKLQTENKEQTLNKFQKMICRQIYLQTPDGKQEEQKKNNIQDKQTLIEFLKSVIISNNQNTQQKYIIYTEQLEKYKFELKQQNEFYFLTIKSNSIDKNQLIYNSQNNQAIKIIQTLSHELKTPLNFSIQMVQIAKQIFQDNKLFEEIESYLDPILYSNNILLNVINDYLDFALINNFKFKLNIQRLDIKKVLKESLDYITFSANLKFIQLKLILEDPVNNFYQEINFTKGGPTEQQILLEENNYFMVNNDPERIKQIVLNFLTNSLKFTNKNGSITLKAKIIQQNPKTIEISCQDTGIGIQKSRFNSIFNNQSPLDEKKRMKYNKFNFGMGLLISNQIASRISGQGNSYSNAISLNSEINKGSIFSFKVQDLDQLPQEQSPPICKSELMLEKKRSKTEEKMQPQERLYPLDNKNLKQCSIFIQECDLQSQSPIKKQLPYVSKKKFTSVSQPNSIESNKTENQNQTNKNVLQISPFNFQLLSLQNTQKRFSAYSTSANTITKQQIDIQTLKNISSCGSVINLPQKYQENNIINSNSQVLIVDDNQFNALMLQKKLNQYQITSDIAYDGLEALKIVQKKIKNQESNYKLIFMDIDMPILNGHQATQKIISLFQKQNQASSYIIGFSAYSTEDEQQKAFQSGMVGYITKPLQNEQLNNVLNKWYFQTSQ